jgi:hypothetical protein
MFDCHRQLDLKGSCSHSHDWISFSTHSHDWISFSTKEIINCVVALAFTLYAHENILLLAYITINHLLPKKMCGLLMKISVTINLHAS